MKYVSLYALSLGLLLPFLGGCGKQGAFDRADLSLLEQGFESRQTINDVTVSAKHLTSKDRVYVFGQKNLSFSPVLMTVENRGDGDVFFDTRRQAFQLAKVDPKGQNSTGLRVLAPILWIGVGIASFIGFTANIMLDPNPYYHLWSIGSLSGMALSSVGLIRCLSEDSIQEKECRKASRINHLSKSIYLIKKSSKESLLLFFEKNKVLALLPITLELQTEPLQTLNFELSTHRASQANEFIYKTA